MGDSTYRAEGNVVFTNKDGPLIQDLVNARSKAMNATGRRAGSDVRADAFGEEEVVAVTCPFGKFHPT